MVLEKKRVLRKIEIIVTEDDLNEQSHLVYEDQFFEDGVLLVKKIHREVRPIEEVKVMVDAKKKYIRSEI